MIAPNWPTTLLMDWALAWGLRTHCRMSTEATGQFPDILKGRPKAQGCPHCRLGPDSGLQVRFGSFWRKSDGKRIQRFLCQSCGRTYSEATFDPCFGQKKRQLNRVLYLLLASAVSMRRCAIHLRVHRTTVARKLRFLGELARIELKRQLESYVRLRGEFRDVQFDDMETLEHTKCKPVSIPVLVDAKERLILGIDACSMPAKGKLAAMAVRKYGKRADHRRQTLASVLSGASRYIHPEAVFSSDSCPRYPRILKGCFPQAKHHTEISRQGCVVGQGELKRGGYDPLFSLNHTCATLRADCSRLIRRTWNTSKRIPPLRDHLILCAVGHNQRILNRLARNQERIIAA